MGDLDALVSVLGPPDAFSAKLAVLDGNEVYLQSFTYADLAVRFDLMDGTVIGREALDPFPDGTLLPLQYHYVGVRLAMTEAELRESLGSIELTAFGGDSLGLPAGSKVLASGQLLIGLFADRVVYVQTYPLVPDATGELKAYLDGSEP